MKISYNMKLAFRLVIFGAILWSWWRFFWSPLSEKIDAERLKVKRLEVERRERLKLEQSQEDAITAKVKELAWSEFSQFALSRNGTWIVSHRPSFPHNAPLSIAQLTNVTIGVYGGASKSDHDHLNNISHQFLCQFYYKASRIYDRDSRSWGEWERGSILLHASNGFVLRMNGTLEVTRREFRDPIPRDLPIDEILPIQSAPSPADPRRW